jgi:hypothetical protein
MAHRDNLLRAVGEAEDALSRAIESVRRLPGLLQDSGLADTARRLETHTIPALQAWLADGDWRGSLASVRREVAEHFDNQDLDMNGEMDLEEGS